MLTDGHPAEVVEIEVDGARVHRVELEPGMTTVGYTATVDGGRTRRAVGAADWATALRPSRYCPSDQLEGFAHTEFDATMPRGELVAAVAAWVHRRLRYVGGASRPVDTAVDTLLLGQGVCRDYAHLTITLCGICAGRDAADTAFLTAFGGVARFESMAVTATVNGALPAPEDAPFPVP